MQLGAVDFLERPLSHHKLHTLWQHKIRHMMRSANGGVLPRAPSCPQLATASSGSDALAAADACLARASSVAPGFSCPATPSIQLAPPQPSSSGASGASGAAGTRPTTTAAAAGGGQAERSDATSGPAAAQTPATSLPALLPVPPTLPPAPGFVAAPLACMRLGATADLLPTPLHWPALPNGSTWGTPVGCGVPPPLPAASSAQEAASAPAADLAIKWCPPGALPMPASTYEVRSAGLHAWAVRPWQVACGGAGDASGGRPAAHKPLAGPALPVQGTSLTPAHPPPLAQLLLPEDFSLARPAVEAREAGSCAPGPLGLRLTVSPKLLADINACLAPAPAVAADAATA